MKEKDKLINGDREMNLIPGGYENRNLKKVIRRKET